MEQSIPVFISPEARVEPATARRILSQSANEVDGLQLVDDEPDRGIDPTIAVALISGVSSTIVAAIPALQQIWSREKKRLGKIILSFDDKSTIEFETGDDAKQMETVETLVNASNKKIVAIHLG